MEASQLLFFVLALCSLLIDTQFECVFFVASDSVVYLCEWCPLGQVADLVLLIDDEPVPQMLCIARDKGVFSDEACLFLHEGKPVWLADHQ